MGVCIYTHIYIGEYYRVFKGEFWSLDCSSNGGAAAVAKVRFLLSDRRPNELANFGMPWTCGKS